MARVGRTLKTEAIVLRSLRYGEADRILHLYTPHHGRLGAIAKGARRARSRFGARLEPFFRTRLVLHRGRGELATITAADTVAAHAALRADGAALDAASRACDAVARLFESGDPNPAAYALLANHLAGLAGGRAGTAGGLAFRLKLLVAAGLAPQLGACAACGEREHLTAFSPAAGGVVCSACEASAFTLDAEAHAFLAGALARPLIEAPTASPRALRQAERAISETAAHHGHVRLRPL
jgi:DNA repair protein RecO (recombination protein O)